MIKTYNPFAYGRYYQFFIESDGTDYTLTTKDISTAAIASGKLKIPADFIVCDVNCQPHYVADGEGTAVAVVNGTIVDQTSGASLIALPDVADFDYMTVFVFGYEVPAAEANKAKKTTKKTAKKAE